MFQVDLDFIFGEWSERNKRSKNPHQNKQTNKPEWETTQWNKVEWLLSTNLFLVSEKLNIYELFGRVKVDS